LVCVSLLAELDSGDFAFVECLGLDLSLLLKTVNHVLVSPTDLVRQSLDGAVFTAGLQSQNPQGFRNNHALLPVVRRRNTLEELELGEGSGTTGGLVGSHATDRLEEDTRRCPVMEGTGLFRVHNVTLVEEIMVAELVPEERAADVDLLAPYDDNLLARKDLLGDNGGKATEEVALSIDYHRGRREGGHDSKLLQQDREV